MYKAYSVIYVAMDKLSKYGHFLPLKGNFTSQIVAENFMQYIVKLQGIPKTIVSDCDKTFTNKFWNHLFTKMGTTLSISTAYHPKTDGQTKVLNKHIEHYLRYFVLDNPKSWTELLPWAELFYITSFHTGFDNDPPLVIEL